MKSDAGDVSSAPSVDPVDPVDAVFVIGTGSKNGNEELRYALRNVARNCPFVRNVYISGECPKWVNRDVVIHLPWRDRFRFAKDSNIVDKLAHACEAPGIARRILLCSDDQFQTRVCTWDDFAPKWLREYDSSDSWYEDKRRAWHSRLHRTLERERLRRIAYGLGEGGIYYWEPHIYSQIDRDSFLRFAEWSDYEHRDDTIIYTGYYNFIGQRGEHVSDHTFIWSGYKWDKPTTHIAYTDDGFDAAMEYLRKAFPEPCRFERSGSGDFPAVQPAPSGASKPPVRTGAAGATGMSLVARPKATAADTGVTGRGRSDGRLPAVGIQSRMSWQGYSSLYSAQAARIGGRASFVAEVGGRTDAGVAELRELFPDAAVYRVGGSSRVQGVLSAPGDCYSPATWAGLPRVFDLIVARGRADAHDMVRGVYAMLPHLAAGGVLVFEGVVSEECASALQKALPKSVVHRIPRASSVGHDIAVVYTKAVA